MKRPLFTPEELAELAAFDAEVDEDELNAQDYRDSAQRDKDAVMAEKGIEQRVKAKKLAAKKREYYEANKEQLAAKKREYYEANKEQLAAYQREYREANKEQLAAYQREYYAKNPEKHEARKAHMREYSRRRYLEKKGEKA